MSWEFMDDELLEEDVWGGNLGFILPLLQTFSGGFFWKSYSLLVLGSSSNLPSSSSPILLPTSAI